MDEIVEKLNRLVPVLQNQADERNDPYAMKTFLKTITTMVEEMKRKASDTNEKEPTLSSLPETGASLSGGSDFRVAPTGDNANGANVNDDTEFHKNKWEDAINGRNANFQDLVDVVRLLMERARVLKQNYMEVQTKIDQDSEVPNTLNELRTQLNQLITVLSSQDHKDEAQNVDALRNDIRQLKTEVDQKVKTNTATDGSAAVASDASLSEHVIANGSGNLKDAANTGATPAVPDLTDVQESGEVFAVDAWVNAIKQRNINFVVLVDAIYELIDIVSKIEGGVKIIESRTKEERKMHSSTLKLIQELYRV